MGAWRQFASVWRAGINFRRAAAFVAIFAAAWCGASASLRADSTLPGAIGRVEGRDVSVESGTAGGGGSESSPSINVTNGSIITVHSGRAHLTLFAGGDVEICGPAKLTLLQSSGSITLALNFGRVRTKLPAKTSFRVFTPTIIATPIDIGGGTRDIAVGLNLDDSLCVLATSGAIQLEHQFSGDKLIVPQAGEFFLSSGQLVPVAGTPGSCECDDGDDLQQPAPSAPQQYASAQPAAGTPVVSVSVSAATASATPAPSAEPSPAAMPAAAPSAARPPLAAADSAPVAKAAHAPVAVPAPDASGSPAAPPTALSAVPPPQFEPLPVKSEPDFDLQVLAHASELHPVAPAERPEAPEQPPVSVPASATIASPLVFMASAPTAPAAPTPDMILLIREAKVSSDWEFTGDVDAPSFAVEVQHALGETAPSAPQPPAAGSSADRPHGFWAALKRIFVGSGTVSD